MAFEPGGETYEDVPYAELTYQETHPGGLATIGLLLGLEPAAVETCRVLELGCASGANLLAMARWRPRVFTGETVLFTAAATDFGCDLATLWAPWLPELQVRRVPGSHLELVQEHVSLETPVGDGESVMSDLIEDANASAPEVETSDKLRSIEVWRALKSLQPRQQQVLIERYGLNGEKPKTLEEVGRILGITRERVRQLETKALADLRKAAPGLELYLRT